MSVKRPSRIAALAIGTVVIVSSAFSQPEPAKSHQLAYPIDSGAVQNFGPLVPGDDAPGGVPSVVFVHEIDVLGAQWLRLQFDQVLLSGSKANNNASYLLITSMWDGASQKMYADDVHNWNNTSAYLNGGTLVVELYAHQGTGANRFLMSELTVGEVQPGGVPIESICGPTDDRTLSQDNRQARLWPRGCTAFMIENGDFGNRFLTAGHCIENTTTNAVVEFNVQLSTAAGTATHPPPNDQWPVPAGQINSNGGGVAGNDYAQFFTAVNGTGLTPREANGCGAYRLAAAAPAVASQTIRITGYGETTTTGLPNNQNMVQKTHTGPFVSNVGTLISYATDTTAVNSGSPVVDITGGGDAIGIHTHGGCTPTGGSNQGTDIGHPGLQGFLAAPAGTGIKMGVNSITSLFAADNRGNDGGAVYFDIVTGPFPVSIKCLQGNVDAAIFGAAFTCEVYTIPGTHVGSVVGGVWTKVANGSGIVGQRDSASMITLDADIDLPPNSTTGIAIVLDASTAHNYTDGANSYADGTITVNLGSASNVAFTANVFNPRTFNGTICYTSTLLPCTAVEIAAMPACSSQIDMDSLPVGPTTAAALNMAGAPFPADLASVSLFAKPFAAAGVYNTNIVNGQALARVGGPGNLRIIDNGGFAAFDATTYDLTFQHDHTQFGFEVGDWNGPAVVNLYDGSTLVANVVTSATSTRHFIEIQSGCTFDRATIDVSTTAGTFVLTEIWTEGCVPGCPCACNFDLSTGIDVCDIFDFLAFQNGFVAGDPCACDIDTSTGKGVCDIFDFLAFQNDFVAGCP